MKLYDLKTLHMKNPVIDKVPYFSWKIESDKQNVLQTSFRILVKNVDEVLWDSGIIASREQSFVEYQGKELSSRSKYTWIVTVWDNYEEQASESAEFETAFLESSDWKAKWVECSFERQTANEYKFGNTYPPILFEKEFEFIKKIKSAKVYATSHGVYRLLINGKRPDDREFAPEFTPYEAALYYQIYDITNQVSSGMNQISMYVGDGWYFSAQAGPVMKNQHKEPSILFQMEIEYEDGSTEKVISDEKVTCRTDYIIYSDLYQGEKQDFTLEESKKQEIIIMDYGYDFLSAQPMMPIRPIKTIPAVAIFTSPKGETIVDFGQVLAGRARVHIDVSKNSEVVLEYFEVLDDKGNYKNTMFAPQKDTVISNGDVIDHEALFTFHGFRYIRVTGMENPQLQDFTAVLLSTEKENVGTFECSDSRLNRLYQNIRWSQYNNMMSVPTDCPSREKAGWTGDLLIYAKTAMINEEMTPFLNSWLNSVREDQAEDGTIMIVSPYMKLYDGMLLNVAKTFGDEQVTGVAGWSDAIVWVPYDMYQVTGNKLVLKENFAAMNKWCKYIIRTAAEKKGYQDIPWEYDQYLWNSGFHFGEWLVPSRPGNPSDPFEICKESAFYIAPFFGYMTICKMVEICSLLDKEEEAVEYRRIAEKMKQSIQEGLIRRNLLPDYLMGAYVLAFAFDLVPNDMEESYKKRLVDLIRKNDNCLDTGFLATMYILDTLCEIGESNLAYDILWQSKRPSWLYEVDHGATAIWEAWDADDAQSTDRFVSYDHYAFGCVDDWICRHIAGIDSNTPGFSHMIINPDMDERLSFCKRSLVCESGVIKVEWDKEKLYVTIPCNTTATVKWRGKETEIGSGEYTF